MKERKGIPFATNDKVREAIREVLPFHPRLAAKAGAGGIVTDMRAPSPHGGGCCRAMWVQAKRSWPFRGNAGGHAKTATRRR